MFPSRLVARIVFGLATAQLALFVLMGMAVSAHPTILRSLSIGAGSLFDLAEAVLPILQVMAGMN